MGLRGNNNNLDLGYAYQNPGSKHVYPCDEQAAKNMLENTIKWRRDYRPDELDPEYIKPEVKKEGVRR